MPIRATISYLEDYNGLGPTFQVTAEWRDVNGVTQTAPSDMRARITHSNGTIWGGIDNYPLGTQPALVHFHAPIANDTYTLTVWLLNAANTFTTATVTVGTSTALEPGDLRLNAFFASPPTDTTVRYTVKILNTSTHSGTAIVRVEIKDPSTLTVAALEDLANFPVSTAEYVKNFEFAGLLPSTSYTAHLIVFSGTLFLLSGGPKAFSTLATPPPPPPPTATFDGFALTASPLSAPVGSQVDLVAQATLNGAPVAVSGIAVDLVINTVVNETPWVTDVTGQIVQTLAGTNFMAEGSYSLFIITDQVSGAVASNVVTVTISASAPLPPPPPEGGGGIGGSNLITGLLGGAIAIGLLGSIIGKLPKFGTSHKRRRVKPTRYSTRRLSKDLRNAFRTCPTCRRLGHKCRRCQHA